MKTLRADLSPGFVVLMVADDSGGERPHVIADDGGDAYKALRATIEGAAGDVPPRASVGRSEPLRAEVVEEIPRPQPEPEPELGEDGEELGGSWIGDAARFVGDARRVIETDERAGAAWGSFLGVLRDLSADPRGGDK